jgi:hypothetical protein
MFARFGRGQGEKWSLELRIQQRENGRRGHGSLRCLRRCRSRGVLPCCDSEQLGRRDSWLRVTHRAIGGRTFSREAALLCCHAG